MHFNHKFQPGLADATHTYLPTLPQLLYRLFYTVSSKKENFHIRDRGIAEALSAIRHKISMVRFASRS